MDGKLFLRLDITDAISERRDNGLVRHLANLAVDVVEALDIFLQGLSKLLLDAAQVARSRRMVVSALEVGDKAAAHLLPGRDQSHGEIQENVHRH